METEIQYHISDLSTLKEGSFYRIRLKKDIFNRGTISVIFRKNIFYTYKCKYKHKQKILSDVTLFKKISFDDVFRVYPDNTKIDIKKPQNVIFKTISWTRHALNRAAERNISI